MICLLLLLALIALLNAGLLLWVGVSINNNHKESIEMANLHEEQLNAALDVLKQRADAIVAALEALKAANPDLTDEIARVEALASQLKGAVETTQGGNVPEPGDPTGGTTDPGTDGGSTDGGSTSGGEGEGGSSETSDTESSPGSVS